MRKFNRPITFSKGCKLNHEKAFADGFECDEFIFTCKLCRGKLDECGLVESGYIDDDARKDIEKEE